MGTVFDLVCTLIEKPPAGLAVPAANGFDALAVAVVFHGSHRTTCGALPCPLDDFNLEQPGLVLFFGPHSADVSESPVIVKLDFLSIAVSE
jgi:hypothetical protein